MAIELASRPEFAILTELVLPPRASEIYTKLNNHHGDQFGKCRITVAGTFRVAKIRIVAHEQQALIGKTPFAIWGELGNLKIRHAGQGKDTLRKIAMLLVEAEELPVYLQNQIAVVP